MEHQPRKEDQTTDNERNEWVSIRICYPFRIRPKEVREYTHTHTRKEVGTALPRRRSPERTAFFTERATASDRTL